MIRKIQMEIPDHAYQSIKQFITETAPDQAALHLLKSYTPSDYVSHFLRMSHAFIILDVLNVLDQVDLDQPIPLHQSN